MRDKWGCIMPIMHAGKKLYAKRHVTLYWALFDKARFHSWACPTPHEAACRGIAAITTKGKADDRA
jgi:hypothetical protein